MIPVCPKCDCSLLILRLADAELDFCDRCRGLWLDTGEIEILAGDTHSPLLKSLRDQPGSPTPQKHLCPRCDAALVEFTVPGTKLQLDRCPKGHGLWFDADELEQILAMLPNDPLAAKTINLLNDLFHYQKPKNQGD